MTDGCRANKFQKTLIQTTIMRYNGLINNILMKLGEYDRAVDFVLYSYSK